MPNRVNKILVDMRFSFFLNLSQIFKYSVNYKHKRECNSWRKVYSFTGINVSDIWSEELHIQTEILECFNKMNSHEDNKPKFFRPFRHSRRERFDHPILRQPLYHQDSSYIRKNLKLGIDSDCKINQMYLQRKFLNHDSLPTYQHDRHDSSWPVPIRDWRNSSVICFDGSQVLTCRHNMYCQREYSWLILINILFLNQLFFKIYLERYHAYLYQTHKKWLILGVK